MTQSSKSMPTRRLVDDTSYIMRACKHSKSLSPEGEQVTSLLTDPSKEPVEVPVRRPNSYWIL